MFIMFDLRFYWCIDEIKPVFIMSSTPQVLRRSKRKQVSAPTLEQTTLPTSNTTGAPRKRMRKTSETVVEPATENISSGSDVGKVDTPSESRPHRVDQPLPPFLALPRELRDEIYRHVLDQDGSTTLKTGSRNIATRCGLVGVNNQICEEFLDAVLLYAPTITTTVKNHNFAHVVTFLNRLSNAQLARLSSRDPQAADRGMKRKRKIGIILSYSAGAKDSRAHLNRWLDRFDMPDKRGKEIEFEYTGDGTYDNGGRKQRPYNRTSASERWSEEADKIRRAGRQRKPWSYLRC